ncbi:hypothetical protein ACSBR1_001369 [Camellia fascicularis]
MRYEGFKSAGIVSGSFDSSFFIKIGDNGVAQSSALRSFLGMAINLGFLVLILSVIFLCEAVIFHPISESHRFAALKLFTPLHAWIFWKVARDPRPVMRETCLEMVVIQKSLLLHFQEARRVNTSMLLYTLGYYESQSKPDVAEVHMLAATDTQKLGEDSTIKELRYIPFFGFNLMGILEFILGGGKCIYTKNWNNLRSKLKKQVLTDSNVQLENLDLVHTQYQFRKSVSAESSKKFSILFLIFLYWDATLTYKAEGLELQRQLRQLQTQYDMLSGQASTLIQGRRAQVAATSSVLKNTNVRLD